MKSNLLTKLIYRGDEICIDWGKLIIKPVSGKPIPPDWLKTHHNQIVSDICQLFGLTPYSYLSFSTGYYKTGDNGKLSGGVALQFENPLTGETAFTVFNAELKRQRTTKQGNAGERLPGKQFRVGARSNFQKFWNRTSLKQTDQSKIHRYMGLLKGLLFTFEPDQNGRAKNDTIKVLDLPYEAIKAALSLPKSCLSHAYAVPKPCLRSVPKGLAPAQSPQDLQPNQTKGGSNYGNKVIRKHGNKGNTTPPPTIPIENVINGGVEAQSGDDWIADYSAANVEKS